MLTDLYISSFMDMVLELIDIETNHNNVYLLEQIKANHFITGFNHQALIEPLEACLSNCNHVCKPMYNALLIGVRMELDILKSMN